jgi:hypothetical protein
MTRRRYIQDPKTFELIEITDGYQPEMRADAGALWGDRSYDGMRATDGTDISTRTKHRAYMQANGLATADDFQQTWAKAQQARESYYQRGGSFSRSDIERAMHQVNNRK